MECNFALVASLWWLVHHTSLPKKVCKNFWNMAKSSSTKSLFLTLIKFIKWVWHRLSTKFINLLLQVGMNEHLSFGRGRFDYSFSILAGEGFRLSCYVLLFKCRALNKLLLFLIFLLLNVFIISPTLWLGNSTRAISTLRCWKKNYFRMECFPNCLWSLRYSS